MISIENDWCTHIEIEWVKLRLFFVFYINDSLLLLGDSLSIRLIKTVVDIKFKKNIFVVWIVMHSQFHCLLFFLVFTSAKVKLIFVTSALIYLSHYVLNVACTNPDNERLITTAHLTFVSVHSHIVSQEKLLYDNFIINRNCNQIWREIQLHCIKLETRVKKMIIAFDSNDRIKEKHHWFIR